MVFNLAVITVIHSLGVFVQNVVYLFNSLRSTPDNCATVISNAFCGLLRAPSFYAVPMFAFMHMTMFIERCVAYVKRDEYERQSNKLGMAFVLLNWIICISLSHYTIGVDIFSNIPRVECTPTLSPYIRTTALFYLACVFVDALTAIGDIILWIQVKRESNAEQWAMWISNKTNPTKTYSLSKAYQRRENLRVLGIMFPIALTFTTGHLIYTIAGNRTYHGFGEFIKESSTSIEGLMDYQKDIIAFTTGSLHPIFTLLTIVMVKMYVRLGQKLKEEKKEVIIKQDADAAFKIFTLRWQLKLRIALREYAKCSKSTISIICFS
uniref:G_PROTEIN_RECEP_F1_2 domain-containing protein n=1 Tax=Bursaphelenchus xylophilus TaxID=6326 RepID=A0A1I7S4G3_BURXY